MRSAFRILSVLFTLLLAAQGEAVLNARSRMILCPASTALPENLYGVCYPVRFSSDGIPVCCYDPLLSQDERVEALSADELARRGVCPLRDVLTACSGRKLRLFLDLRPPMVETLSEEQCAERELIRRRAGRVLQEDGLSEPEADELCESLIDSVLDIVAAAGFRLRDVWLVLHDVELCHRLGSRDSGVRICCAASDGIAVAGVQALLVHWTEVGSREDVRKLQRQVRHVAVWDVNTLQDAEAMRAAKADFLLTDDPEFIGRP